MASEAEKKSNRKGPVPFAAGATAGGLTAAVLQPLDVLRTRLQTSASGTSLAAATRGVLAEGGAVRLWAGVSPTLMRLTLGAGLHFNFVEIYDSALKSALAELGPRFAPNTISSNGGVSGGLEALSNVAVGALARATAAALLCPLTVVKTRVESGESPSMLAALRQGRLFSGVGSVVLGGALFSGLFYASYKEGKNRAGAQSPPEKFAVACGAAAISTAITQPIDVVRTWQQLQLAGLKNAEGAARGVFNEGGVRGFYKGFLPRAVKRSLQTAMVWTMYESLVNLFSTGRHSAVASAKS